MKKGFTLVEILGVISILAIIAIITVPSVDYVINNGKKKSYDAQIDSVKLAIKDYATDNKLKIDSNATIILSLEDLKNENYLDFNFKNPITNKCFSNKSTFKYTKNEITVENLIDGTDKDCGTFETSPTLYLKGDSNLKIELGEYFIDPGYQSYSSEGTDISSNVSVEGKVDRYNTGKYELVYEVNNKNKVATKIRTVEVVDKEGPSILGLYPVELLSTDTDFDVLKNIVTIDNSNQTVELKTVTNIVLGETGQYYIDYIATDIHNNVTKKRRDVYIKDSYNINYTDESYFTFSNGTITGYSIDGPKDVIIPSEIGGVTVTTIGAEVFKVKGITSVIFPDTIKTIKSSAFSMNSIEELILPENIEIIEAGAFMVNQIEEILIPESIELLGEMSFYMNKIKKYGLPSKSFNIEGDVFNMNDCNFYQEFLYSRNSDGTIDYSNLIGYNSKNKNPEVPETVKNIADYAFMQAYIKSITLPEGLESIGYCGIAFNSIKTVTIPSTVTSIDPGAFSSNALETIYMPGRTSNNLGTNWYDDSPTFIFN